MANWYYAVGGTQYGPIPQEQLAQLISAGQMQVTDLVWQPGMAQWAPANTVPALASSTAGVPPVQPTAYQHPQASPQQYYESGAAQQAAKFGQGPMLDYQTPPTGFESGPPRYAGFWIRFAAWFIDQILMQVAGCVTGLVIGIAFAAMTIGAGRQATRGAEMTMQLSSSLLGIVIAWIYQSLMESSKLQATLGKLACGLKVTDVQGRRISFGRATGRYFGMIISGLILCIGYLMIAWDDRKQGLHDKMASTLVLQK